MAGINFRAIVKSFNISKPYHGLGREYVEQKSNEVAAYLGYEFKNGIILKAATGISIGRSFRIYQENDQIDWGLSAFRFGDDRTPLNSDFADGLFYRVGLTYRFHLDKK